MIEQVEITHQVRRLHRQAERRGASAPRTTRTCVCRPTSTTPGHRAVVRSAAEADQHRPETLGQASRLSGVTPAAISLLLVHLKKSSSKGTRRDGHEPADAAADARRLTRALRHRLRAGCAGARRWPAGRAGRPAAGLPGAARSKWNQVYNLTAVRDPAEMLTQHLLDSLAVSGRCGGTLQGRPSAAARRRHRRRLAGRGDRDAAARDEVTCVDTVGKKAAFIQQAAANLQLPNLHGCTPGSRSSAGDLRRDRLARLRVPGRLRDLVDAAQLARAGRLDGDEGQAPGRRDRAPAADVEVFHVEQLTVPGLDAERCLVWMRPSAARRRYT